MKITYVEPISDPPPPEKVIIEMTYEEAVDLRSYLGHRVGNLPRTVDVIHNQLTKRLGYVDA